MPYYCTVPRCTSMGGKTKNVSFHQFPKDEQLARLWNKILKRGKPYTKYSKVCSLHFKPEDYTLTIKGQWRTLRKDAIPSQNLPLESPTSYCRQQNPNALSSNDTSPDPQIMESQMRQMVNIIYMQTMLAMQASSPRDAGSNDSESAVASTTRSSEPNEHSEPLVLQTSQSNLNIEQLSRLPSFANFANNGDQSDNSSSVMPRSFECNECSRLFKDPDVFLLHKRGHAKKSEKENNNANSIEKTQEMLRTNPILANLLNSNMADKMQSIYSKMQINGNPNNISTIDNQIMAALAVNMEVFIRNLSSVNEKKDDDNDESDNDSQDGEMNEKSDNAVSDDENGGDCDEEFDGDGDENSDDCVKLEETVKSDCLVNEST